MALLYMDGFDVGDSVLRWATSGTIRMNYGMTPRLSGGMALQIDTPVNITTAGLFRAFLPSAQVYIGAALQVTLETTPSSNVVAFFQLYGDGGVTSHLYLHRSQNNAVALYRGAPTGTASSPGGTLLAQTAAGVLDGYWHSIEMSATIDSATGHVVVNVDGVKMIDFTGNTRNGGTLTTLDTIKFQVVNWNGSCPIVLDDLYICNNTGTTNNTFLGDIRVQTMLPNAAGSSTQLTPTGSANNWQNVAEVPYNDATYNTSAVVGQRDTYGLSDLVAGTDKVYAVQTVTHANKSDAGAANMKVALKSGASVNYGPVQPLGTTNTAYATVFETNPATTAAWTVADSNGLEAGVEVA
jgi:hypothetical protein